MPFGAHETLEVHEILNEKINLINHFSMYAKEAQDRHLRQMLDRHLQSAIQSYDILVSYTHDYNAANNMKRPYSMPNVQPQSIQYGLHNPSQQAPQTQGKMNDQQILMAVLSCHKNSARNHMHASLECADPNIRQMLINGALNCANQAYEVFVYMNQQGYYQVPTMSDHTAKTFLHAYQPVNESAMAQSGQMGGMSMNNVNANMQNMGMTGMGAMAGMNTGMGQGYNQGYNQGAGNNQSHMGSGNPYGGGNLQQ